MKSTKQRFTSIFATIALILCQVMGAPTAYSQMPGGGGGQDPQPETPALGGEAPAEVAEALDAIPQMGQTTTLSPAENNTTAESQNEDTSEEDEPEPVVTDCTDCAGQTGYHGKKFEYYADEQQQMLLKVKFEASLDKERVDENGFTINETGELLVIEHHSGGNISYDPKSEKTYVLTKTRSEHSIRYMHLSTCSASPCDTVVNTDEMVEIGFEVHQDTIIDDFDYKKEDFTKYHINQSGQWLLDGYTESTKVTGILQQSTANDHLQSGEFDYEAKFKHEIDADFITDKRSGKVDYSIEGRWKYSDSYPDDSGGIIIEKDDKFSDWEIEQRHLYSSEYNYDNWAEAISSTKQSRKTLLQTTLETTNAYEKKAFDIDGNLLVNANGDPKWELKLDVSHEQRSTAGGFVLQDIWKYNTLQEVAGTSSSFISDATYDVIFDGNLKPIGTRSNTHDVTYKKTDYNNSLNDKSYTRNVSYHTNGKPKSQTVRDNTGGGHSVNFNEAGAITSYQVYGIANPTKIQLEESFSYWSAKENEYANPVEVKDARHTFLHLRSVNLVTIKLPDWPDIYGGAA